MEASRHDFALPSFLPVKIAVVVTRPAPSRNFIQSEHGIHARTVLKAECLGLAIGGTGQKASPCVNDGGPLLVVSLRPTLPSPVASRIAAMAFTGHRERIERRLAGNIAGACRGASLGMST